METKTPQHGPLGTPVTPFTLERQGSRRTRKAKQQVVGRVTFKFVAKTESRDGRWSSAPGTTISHHGSSVVVWRELTGAFGTRSLPLQAEEVQVGYQSRPRPIIFRAIDDAS